MYIWLLIFQFAAGIGLSFIVNLLSEKVIKKDYRKSSVEIYFIILAILLVFNISYMKFGLDKTLLITMFFNYLLIMVSVIDLRYKLIPNYFVICMFLLGIMRLASDNISVGNSLSGMLFGGGFLFILSLIPGAIGGGDVKFMFAAGLFLGFYKTLIAVLLGFIAAGAVSAVLLLMKLKGRKEFIPLGPFLALGCFLALHFF